jgi:hypothetical protein
MSHFRNLSLIAAIFLVTNCVVHSARAAEPPADVCSLLPAAEVNTTLGQAYNSPQKSVAPRPFANTAEGTDCSYRPKGATQSTLLFRAYFDPSPSAAADLFTRLSKFYGTPTPIAGLAETRLILTRPMGSMSARATFVSTSILIRWAHSLRHWRRS